MTREEPVDPVLAGEQMRAAGDDPRWKACRRHVDKAERRLTSRPRPTTGGNHAVHHHSGAATIIISRGSTTGGAASRWMASMPIQMRWR